MRRLQDGTERKPEPDLLPRALLLAAVWLLYTALFLRWDLLVDDAFISYRYADHLAHGLGLVYNPGERVEGYSNLSWVMLLAGCAKLGLEPPQASLLLGYLSGLAGVVLTYRAGRQRLALGPWAALVGSLLVACGVSSSFWAAAGLESPLFSLLLLALWAGSAGSSWSSQAAWTAIVGALLVITRPEGVVLASAGPLLLWRRGGPSRAVGLAAGVVGVIAASHLVWRLSYYGDPLPTPFYAKVAPTAAASWRGLRYLWEYLLADCIWPWVLLLGWVPWRRREVQSLSGIVSAYLLFIVLVGGDGLYRSRLMAHVTPLLALVFASGLQGLLQRHPRATAPSAAALVWALGAPLTRDDFFRGYSLPEVRGWEARWMELGLTLHRRAPPGSELATNVAGRLPYYSRLPTLDLLGLTNPVIAKRPVTGLGSGYAGHERADPETVLSRRPELVYFSVLDGLPLAAFSRADMARSVLEAGSLFRYGVLLDHPEFLARYRPIQLCVSAGTCVNLFVRKGGRSEQALALGSSETERLPARARAHGPATTR